MTASLLCEERREGSLALLFLTKVKGFDIVLSKLAAVALLACQIVPGNRAVHDPRRRVAGGVLAGRADPIDDPVLFVVRRNIRAELDDFYFLSFSRVPLKLRG